MKKLLFILLICIMSSSAFAATAAGYSISAEVIDLGGASVTANGYRLFGKMRENVPQFMTGSSYTLESRFTGIVFGSGAVITTEIPVITSIKPNTGLNNKAYRVVINGWFISSDAAASLTSSTHPTISGMVVTIESSTSMECTFNLDGANVGARNVTVTNTGYGKSGSLAGGFTISAPGNVDIIGTAVNEPNPFNPDKGPTQIKYTLSTPASITLYLFNLRGEVVWRKDIPSGQNGGKAGDNSVAWDAISSLHEDVPSGVYVLSIVANSGGTSKELQRVRIAVIRH